MSQSYFQFYDLVIYFILADSVAKLCTYFLPFVPLCLFFGGVILRSILHLGVILRNSC